MNMFKKQAVAKKESMEALKADLTGDHLDAAAIAADLEERNAKPKPRKKATGKKGAKQKGQGKAKKTPTDTVERRRGRPAGRDVKKAEYADQRTSLSFTPTELEKLDRWAHDHYTKRKGAILLAIDMAERYEALVERGLVEDDYEE